MLRCLREWKKLCSNLGSNLALLQELEAIKARVREMEEEAEKLKMLQSEVEKQINSPTGVGKSLHSISLE